MFKGVFRANPDAREVGMKTKRVRYIVIVTGWAFVSIVLFLYAHFYLVVTFPEGSIGDDYHPLANLTGALTGSVLGALLFGYLMVYRSDEQASRRSFRYGIVYMTTLFLVAYFVLNTFVAVLLTVLNQPDANVGRIVDVARGVLTNPASLLSVFIWAMVVAGTQFLVQVSDKFGQGVLWRFITGRYYHPKEETRIFMFLDLNSSTTIAEEIGHARFFEFVREFVADATKPIVQNGGEICSYVGDEIIIAWKVADDKANAECIRCFFAVEDLIAERAAKYGADFGVVPEFKAGVHYGPVTVGEIGVVRKDIVYSGDVLNTAARIQSECNPRGHRLLISGALLDNVRLDAGIASIDLGSIALKGKESAVSLHGVFRETDAPADTSAPYPIVDRLVEAVERYRLVFDPGADDEKWADICYRNLTMRSIEAVPQQSVITIPVMDEYDDLVAGNPVVALHLVLGECTMYEEAEDFLVWTADAGLDPADPRARTIYRAIGEAVPQVRAIVGMDLEPVSNYDFEFNTDAARALRSAR